MWLTIILIYLSLAIASVVLSAYDPYSKTFDFSLSDGLEFSWWQRYFLWLAVGLGCPYFLPKEIKKKISERKYVKEWRTKGSFTKKL
ncbi:hypothetical protein PP175_28795 (plasmid) [Aneurinibacillus sp. Ricciae_BoGa-3]|uniref:hypothetical protein n=1 Tax=Aneurinibacillus sp. Ricciae_BoGa-3 TaxID=3022697 RepID=UPI002340D30A|nr:hypothetical protein [Aneurinibacillus sp. Ricciae_BoGa-3]WCK57189.1 hypothetical protein PP175_28795 [Aneurinibacillus sp. Ricciae_BoGa-3]